jgi:hypothetical protein
LEVTHEIETRISPEKVRPEGRHEGPEKGKPEGREKEKRNVNG